MVIFDAHVHIYPFFDLRRAFRSALDNMCSLALDANQEKGQVHFALILAERSECHFFKYLTSGQLSLPDPFVLKACTESCALIEDRLIKQQLYILPGRQIVSKERIEVLALGTDMNLEDGLPFDFLLVSIREAGGLTGICWSPGKWLFERGKTIAELIETSTPKDLVLLDTGIRPAFYPQPILMSRAQRYGINVLGGSDPFPLQGEEARIGSYCTLSHQTVDQKDPAQSLKDALTVPISRLGKRLSPFQVLSRLQRNAKLKKL